MLRQLLSCMCLMVLFSPIFAAEFPEIINPSSVVNLEGQVLQNPTICNSKPALIAFEAYDSVQSNLIICQSDIHPEDPRYLIKLDLNGDLIYSLKHTYFEWQPVNFDNNVYFLYTKATDSETNHDIYLGILGDEENPLRLTTLAGNETNPKWAPDGNNILFLHDNSSIFILTGVRKFLLSKNMLDLKLTEIYSTSGTINFPVFAPSARYIAFSMRDTSSYGIYTIKAWQGNTPVLIADDPTLDEIKPSWQSDGKLLAFYILDKSESAKIGVIKMSRSICEEEVPFSGKYFIITTEVIMNDAKGPTWVPWFNAIISATINDEKHYPLMLFNISETQNQLVSQPFELPLDTEYQGESDIVHTDSKITVVYSTGNPSKILYSGILSPNNISKISRQMYKESPMFYASKSMIPWKPGAGYLAASDWYTSEYKRSGDDLYIKKATYLEFQGHKVAKYTWIGYGLGFLAASPWFAAYIQAAPNQTWKTNKKANDLLPFGYAGEAILLGSYLYNVVSTYLKVPTREYLDIVDSDASENMVNICTILPAIDNDLFQIQLNIHF